MCKDVSNGSERESVLIFLVGGFEAWHFVSSDVFEDKFAFPIPCRSIMSLVGTRDESDIDRVGPPKDVTNAVIGDVESAMAANASVERGSNCIIVVDMML
mmetsp:Transcript_17233/g.36355  ORF Transcript_17233/g.36355 Transcript_17233/m.36355 type:complete len:100 (+) Transcript_17233:185-484(+)